MAEIRLKENESLKSESKITSLWTVLLEDLKSNVQELALLLRFAKEKLMKSPL